ncbi:MAG: hypothetical protein EA369_01970 [Bradymonadales bacterium]|nr:MAG: hypothetical protein EA369_01970 [Bradymonadales bacterium]
MNRVESLILGAGYTGSRLEMALESSKATRRQARPQCLEFDYDRKESWKNLPPSETCFWTFPAQTQNLKDFSELIFSRAKTIVIVSSTGFFLTTEKDEVVNEESKLDTSQDRVQAEEFLRERGAIVVHAAGIYGPNRSPLDWLVTGRVGWSENFLNLIHVDDLVSVLIQASRLSGKSERWIASDGQPKRWSELILEWQKKYGIGEIKEKTGRRPSKRVDPSRTLSTLQIKLKYPSVYEGVDAMRGSSLSN